MTSSRTAPAAPARRLVPLLLLLAGVLAAATPPPAGAASVVVVSPTADAIADGPVEVVARVTPADGEVVESVEVRLTGPAERTALLAATGDPDADGTQTWSGTVDPLDGVALANGGYALEVAAAPLVGDPQASPQQLLQLRVPPPQRELAATPGPEDATSVSLSWEPVALPDFVGYRVQRRPDAEGGAWRTVQVVDDPRQGSAVDVVPSPGAYRYRLVVVRDDGAGSTLFATSDPRGVRADPEDPGTFDPPRDPDPVPTTEPPAAPTEGPTEGAGEPTPSGGPSAPPTGPQVTVRPPPVAPGTAPQAATPVLPRPGAVPLDDGVFAETLPFDLPQTEAALGGPATSLQGPERGARTSGALNVFTEQQQPRDVLIAIALGLVLLVLAGHLQRYLAAGRRR